MAKKTKFLMYNVETYTIMIILKGAKTTLSLSCKKVVYEIFISLQRKEFLLTIQNTLNFHLKHTVRKNSEINAKVS